MLTVLHLYRHGVEAGIAKDVWVGLLQPVLRRFGQPDAGIDFQIVRASQSKLRLPDDIRSSLGLEFRVQMPVINVPFRLIFAHNPGAENNVISERKNVVRFSVGRTF